MPITTDATGRQAQYTLTGTQRQLQRSGVPITQGVVVVRWKTGETGTVYARMGSSLQTADGVVAAGTDVVHDVQPEFGEASFWLDGLSIGFFASEDTEVTFDILREPY